MGYQDTVSIGPSTGKSAEAKGSFQGFMKKSGHYPRAGGGYYHFFGHEYQRVNLGRFFRSEVLLLLFFLNLVFLP
jgi:hypothetical protein